MKPRSKLARAVSEPDISPAQQAKLDAATTRAKRQLKDVRQQYQRLLEENDLLKGQFDAAIMLKGRIANAPSRAPIRVVSSGKPSEATAVMLVGDWHCEETVAPETVEGVNRYNLTVAGQRIPRIFQNGLKLIDMVRSKSHIDTLVLAVLGDLITGYIHEELVEGNGCSPINAVLFSHQLLKSGIDFLLEHGRFKKIIIPCNWGNHGRTTQKPRISTGAANSYEWMMYQFIAQAYANEPRVSFKVSDGYFTYLPIYGFTWRFHHGDGIRYHGGVGDVDIPLNKAIAQWNKFKRADVDALGHWHTRKMARNFCINGSVIGFNAYSIRIKASYEPPCQSLAIVHPEKGKTVEAPIHVE